MKLRASNGCSGCSTVMAWLTAMPSGARAVTSSASSSSPIGTAGGGPLARPRIHPGVDDQQPVLGRHDRVEQQLPVLAARVAVADPRVGGGDVVAVQPSRPGEHAVVEPRAGRPPGAAPNASASSCTWSACRCGSWPGSAGRGTSRPAAPTPRPGPGRSSTPGAAWLGDRRPAGASSAYAWPSCQLSAAATAVSRSSACLNSSTHAVSGCRAPAARR